MDEKRFVYKDDEPFGPRVLDRNSGQWKGVDLVRDMFLTIPRARRSAAMKPHREWRSALLLAAETLEVELEHRAEGGFFGEASRMRRAAKIIRSALAAAPAAAPAAPAPATPAPRRARPLTKCQADRDGDCYHEDCPQTRDNETHRSARCPLWIDREDT